MEDKRIAAQKRAAEYNRKMIGQLYRHFKGDFYRVLFVAVHSETAELLVIYCKPEDTTKVWARPLAMFLSPVDTKKYPDAKQKMRFALVREVKHPQILPAVIMDRDSALYEGRETVDVCPKCMAAICQAVSELQEVAEGAQCLS